MKLNKWMKGVVCVPLLGVAMGASATIDSCASQANPVSCFEQAMYSASKTAQSTYLKNFSLDSSAAASAAPAAPPGAAPPRAVSKTAVPQGDVTGFPPTGSGDSSQGSGTFSVPY